MDDQQTDFILLYIDNDQAAFRQAIHTIRENLNKDLDIQVLHLKNYVTANAPYLIKDREIRKLLQDEIRNVKNDQYWTGVYQHYLTKHTEESQSPNRKSVKILCKEIAEMMGKMPQDACTAFRLSYPETNTLVQLTNMGMCTPTEKARPSMETYYRSLEREYVRVRNRL